MADILICAIGKAGYITPEFVKPGATVIDVGFSIIEDPSHPEGQRVRGDVDFEQVQHVAHKISPVPGGVGPMTVAVLMRNALCNAELAARRCATECKPLKQ
jgi:5,10-methylene-tetrahydrofolate dehydrogenase/methenyl tetrahydrofolate cyclohydrolase